MWYDLFNNYLCGKQQWYKQFIWVKLLYHRDFEVTEGFWNSEFDRIAERKGASGSMSVKSRHSVSFAIHITF